MSAGCLWFCWSSVGSAGQLCFSLWLGQSWYQVSLKVLVRFRSTSHRFSLELRQKEQSIPKIRWPSRKQSNQVVRLGLQGFSSLAYLWQDFDGHKPINIKTSKPPKFCWVVLVRWVRTATSLWIAPPIIFKLTHPFGVYSIWLHDRWVWGIRCYIYGCTKPRSEPGPMTNTKTVRLKENILSFIVLKF